MIIAKNWNIFFIWRIGKNAAISKELPAPIIFGIRTKNSKAIGKQIYARLNAFKVLAKARITGIKKMTAIHDESKVSISNLDMKILETG